MARMAKKLENREIIGCRKRALNVREWALGAYPGQVSRRYPGIIPSLPESSAE